MNSLPPRGLYIQQLDHMFASTLRNTSLTRYQRTNESTSMYAAYPVAGSAKSARVQHRLELVDVALDVVLLRRHRFLGRLEDDRQVVDRRVHRLAVLAEIHLEQVAAGDLVGTHVCCRELVDVHAVFRDLDVLHELVDAVVSIVQVDLDERGARTPGESHPGAEIERRSVAQQGLVRVVGEQHPVLARWHTEQRLLVGELQAVRLLGVNVPGRIAAAADLQSPVDCRRARRRSRRDSSVR